MVDVVPACPEIDLSIRVAPPVTSPWWREATAPLLEHFRERVRAGGSRRLTIDQVVEWGRERGCTGTMTRHLLAWLSFNGFVRYDERWEAWVPVPRSMAEIVKLPARERART